MTMVRNQEAKKVAREAGEEHLSGKWNASNLSMLLRQKMRTCYSFTSIANLLV